MGRLEIDSKGAEKDTSLYLVATGGEPRSGGGDNPAIALLTSWETSRRPT